MTKPPQPITVNRPLMAGSELDYIRQALDAMHTAGDGGFSFKCADLLQQALAAKRVLLTPSCTDALEMTALLLDLGETDEVIVPSFAFVSTVNAYALRGVKPVFADVRRDTLNLDETQIESLITPRTRAIVALHYAGVGCEMDAICEVASRHGIAVIEDNAHGLFGAYRGRPLGSFGCLSTLSFHETKNFICGEGGALVVNDESFVSRAEIIRDKGTNRQQLFRGQVDKYTWVDLGSSYVLSDLLAAFLLAQLEARNQIQARRRAIWELYDLGLRSWAASNGVQVPTVPEHCEQSYHLYYLIVPTLQIRQDLIEYLNRQQIGTAFHYQPLNTSKMGRSLGGSPGQCPVTEWAADRLIRLPFHHALTTTDQDRVIAAFKTYFHNL